MSGAVDRVLEHLRAVPSEPHGGKGLPPESYLDREWFALERERLFRPEWHAVARVQELARPGDYRSVDLAGEPLVILRDGSGRLRAFSRVCRHRAFPIVQGSGNARRLVCPYHRWSYDLDGKLVTAPFMDQVADFDRERCRLPELPLEEWQGFVLVSPDPEARPLGPRLSAVDALLDPFGFADLVPIEPLEYESPWNWKVMVENFMESYHHLGPHATSLQRTNPAKGSYAMDVAGPCAVLENPAVEGSDPFWVVQVFPTLLFSLSRGPLRVGVWYEMQIDAHDHFRLRIHPLLPREAATRTEVVEGARKVFETIHAEDIPMCRGVQRGLESRLWRPGPQAVHERALWRFHRYLREQLATPRS